MQRIIFRAIVAGQAAVSARRMGAKRLAALCACWRGRERSFTSGTKPLAER
jgi:hypothetical protein